MLIAKTQKNLYYFFYNPKTKKYNQYIENIDVQKIKNNYFLGKSKDYLLEIKDNTIITLYKIIIDDNRNQSKKKESTQENIQNNNPQKSTLQRSWWNRWKNYLLSASLFLGALYLALKKLDDNAKRIIQGMVNRK